MKHDWALPVFERRAALSCLGRATAFIEHEVGKVGVLQACNDLFLKSLHLDQGRVSATRVCGKL